MTEPTGTTEHENPDAVASRVDVFVSCDELREICECTVKLTQLRQNECKHLCVENAAPDIFMKLLSNLSMHKRGMIVSQFDDGLPEHSLDNPKYQHIWEGKFEGEQSS